MRISEIIDRLHDKINEVHVDFIENWKRYKIMMIVIVALPVICGHIILWSCEYYFVPNGQLEEDYFIEIDRDEMIRKLSNNESLEVPRPFITFIEIKMMYYFLTFTSFMMCAYQVGNILNNYDTYKHYTGDSTEPFICIGFLETNAGFIAFGPLLHQRACIPPIVYCEWMGITFSSIDQKKIMEKNEELERALYWDEMQIRKQTSLATDVRVNIDSQGGNQIERERY